MKFKERARKAVKLYFVLVTLITILLMILGSAFDADRTFGYQAYASPLIYAALGVLPVFIFDREKELGVKGYIVQRIVEFVLIEAVFMAVAFSADTIPTEKMGVVIGIALGIAIIYGLTFVIEYVFESAESRKMNEDLCNYQRKQAR